uniref:DUF8039 domain-containing protein n=1 Tax=Lactuca sativa TaxID=4236 RepID=A0A9R1VRG2_LACSA|nr:hypothetical protein LSAT_V11C400196840 [Lactuca sativa]
MSILILKQTQKRWNIPNDNLKKDVLTKCNSQWRPLKKRLKKKCDNQRDPLETYSYLESSTLQRFRHRISSEEFQEISEKARASSMHNKNPAHVDVQTQISKGDLVLSPGEDLFTKVIGPDHPGHTRAVGHDVGSRKGMQGTDKKKMKKHENETIEKLQIFYFYFCFTIYVQMPTPCELVLPYGELDQKYAKGLVFPYRNELIHTLPLRENHLKVMKDDIDSRYENFPLPVLTKEVSNLQGAVGTVIQWPRIAIILAKEQKTKKQIPTTSFVLTIAWVGTNKNIPNQTSSKAGPIEYLRDCLKSNQVVNIVADSGILLVETYDFSDSSFNGSETAFVRYEKDTSTPIGCIFAECNQQLGGLESGHYSGSIGMTKAHLRKRRCLQLLLTSLNELVFIVGFGCFCCICDRNGLNEWIEECVEDLIGIT